MSMYANLFAVFFGGGIGCVARWLLSLRFNSGAPGIPTGTLMANLIGAAIIGAAASYFIRLPDLPSHWKLVVTTGFCGGLTTFSTFSVEMLGMIQEGQWLTAGIYMVLSFVGSLALAALAFSLVSWLAAH